MHILYLNRHHINYYPSFETYRDWSFLWLSELEAAGQYKLEDVPSGTNNWTMLNIPI